jgi:hypothetical protein
MSNLHEPVTCPLHAGFQATLVISVGIAQCELIAHWGTLRALGTQTEKLTRHSSAHRAGAVNRIAESMMPAML